MTDQRKVSYEELERAYGVCSVGSREPNAVVFEGVMFTRKHVAIFEPKFYEVAIQDLEPSAEDVEREASRSRNIAHAYRRLRANGLTPYRAMKYARRGYPHPLFYVLREKMQNATATMSAMLNRVVGGEK